MEKADIKLGELYYVTENGGGFSAGAVIRCIEIPAVVTGGPFFDLVQGKVYPGMPRKTELHESPTILRPITPEERLELMLEGIT